MLTARLAAMRERDDKGFTLVEVLVGMGLMTIIGAMALNYLLGSTQQISRSANASFATAGGRTALTATATALRLADTPTAQPGYPTGRFETVTASSVVFYSNVAADRSSSAARTPPAKIAITATGGQLVEQVYWPKSATVPADYTTNYATTPSSTIVLLTTLGNTDVFTYCTSATDPAITCTGPVPATNGASVATVGVKLVVPGPAGVPTQTFQTMVSITGAVS